MTAIKKYFLSNSCYVHIAAGKSNETNRKRENMRKLTRPRQHRHLKRKDSIRFLVLLVFSGFFIFTGQRNDFSLARCACVTTYSKAAMPLSNLSGVYGSSPPASDRRLPRGYAYGYKISIYIRILLIWLLLWFGNAVHLAIPVSASPRNFPSRRYPSSSLFDSYC